MATIMVTSVGDSGPGSLRAALATANPGDTITFSPNLSNSAIVLESPLLVATANLTIDGAGVSNFEISGNNAVGDFLVSASATIKNLAVVNGSGSASTGGDAAGGILVNGGTLTLSHDSFVNDTAKGGAGGSFTTSNSSQGVHTSFGPGGNAAGAVYVENGGTVIASDLSFFEDSAVPGSSPIAGKAYPISNDAAVTAACYCRGTGILTDRGERPIEALAIGDTVVTASGQHRAIRWIGHRAYAGRFLAANPGAQPIRFRAGSLGGGLPRRDLLVSPEHAMFLDGLLVPARWLVNGHTIAEERGLERVHYFHIELECHDLLLAEGAPSESFLDDDSRGAFQNAAEFYARYPDGVPAAGFCAPRVEQGPASEAIRRQLAAMAGGVAAA